MHQKNMENSKGKLVVIYVAMYIQLHWRHSSSIISFRRWKWNQILLAFGGVLLKTASRTYWSACVDFLNPERLSFSYDFFLNYKYVTSPSKSLDERILDTQGWCHLCPLWQVKTIFPWCPENSWRKKQLMEKGLRS